MISCSHGIINYTTKQIDRVRKVHTIIRLHKSDSRSGVEFFSVPFECKTRKEYFNVLIAFEDETHALEQMKSLSVMNAHVVELMVGDISTLASFLGMSLVVILNARCSLKNKNEYFEISYLPR